MQGLKARLNRIYLGCYPTEASNQPGLRMRINRVILGGILLRFLFMPFTAHNDFLSEHIRVYQIAEGINLFPSFFQFVSHYMDAFFMKIMMPLIPNASQVFVPMEGGITTIEIGNMLNFVDSPYIFRTLFMLKVPYLLLEIATVLLVLKLIGQRKYTMAFLKFWMFNPVIIYAVYIFGRYEIYIFFLLALCLYFGIRKKNIYLAGLFLGMSVVSRAYTFFLIPVLFILLPQRIKDKIIFILFTALPILAVFGFHMTYPGTRTVHGLEAESQFLRFLFDYSLIALGGFKLQLFVLFYLLFLAALLYITYSYKIKGKGAVNLIYPDSQLIMVSMFCLIFFLIFYLTSPSAAQWFSWFIPFAAIIICRHSKYMGLFYLLIVAWFFFWLFNSDIGVFTPYLFSPIDGTYFHQVAENFKLQILSIKFGTTVSVETFINFFRTAYSAIIIWIMVLLGKDIADQLREAKLGDH